MAGDELYSSYGYSDLLSIVSFVTVFMYATDRDSLNTNTVAFQTMFRNTDLFYIGIFLNQHIIRYIPNTLS